MNIDIEILHRVIDGTASAHERQAVERWLCGSAAKKLYFDKLQALRLDGPCAGPTAEQIAMKRSVYLESMLQADVRRRRKRLIWPSVAVAAAVALIIALTGVFDLRSSLEVPTASEYTLAQTQIKSSNGAVEVVTPQGEAMELTSVRLAEEGFAVRGEILEITMQEQPRPQEQMYKVIVRKGAAQTVQLGDGTTVWLNSHSELHFPAVFGDDYRNVFVKGEAYFEVAKENDRPFVVSTGVSDIRVYGTQFNVNTRESGRIETTLVEGSVSVTLPGINKEVMLTPGQMASSDYANGRITVADVDVDLYVGWKRGVYLFRDTPIEKVIREIAFWHDLEVRFEDERLRNEKFSGSVRRDTPLKTILNILEHTGRVSFRVDGNELTVARPGR